MDKAPSTVPAGSRPLVQEGTAAPLRTRGGGRGRLGGKDAALALSRAGGFGPLPLVLAALTLWLGESVPAGAAEAYLPSVGPVLLRFAPGPAAHFTWPPPARAAVVVNPSPAPATSAPSSPNTNDLPLLPTVEELLSSINPPPPAEPEAPIELSAGSPASIPSDLIGSPLSASELLIVTPQMLAEYFKGSPGGPGPSPTNSPPEGELYFRPPVPLPAPGSQATYRIQ